VIWGWVPSLIGYAVAIAVYLLVFAVRRPERRTVALLSEAQPYRPKEAQSG
jgi:hypothetical protein